jgi:hypothetical protein
MLAACRSGNKDDHVERKHAETKVTTGGKHNTHTHARRRAERKETTGRNNIMHAWEEYLMSIGLGFL